MGINDKVTSSWAKYINVIYKLTFYGFYLQYSFLLIIIQHFDQDTYALAIIKGAFFV